MKKVRRPQKVKSLKHAINERFLNYKKQRIHRRTFLLNYYFFTFKNAIKKYSLIAYLYKIKGEFNVFHLLVLTSHNLAFSLLLRLSITF